MERPSNRRTREFLGALKVWLFRLVVLLLLYGLLEGTSLALFRYHTGRWFSFSWVQEQQHQTEYWLLHARPEQKDSHIIHPYLGVVHNPDNPHRELETYPVNRYGFCDIHSPIQKRAPNRVIIGIVGGSVANVFANLGQATLREELKRSPRFAGKEVIVVNLAVSGYKQPQQWFALQYILARGGEFDLLVNIDGFNEVALYPADNWKDGVDPLFPRSWHHRVTGIPQTELRELIGEMAHVKQLRGRWAAWFRQSPLRYSVTMNLIWWLGNQSLYRDENRCVVALQGQRWTNLPPCALGPERPPRDEQAMLATLAALWKRCSLQLQRTCQANGIAYYHFLQPNQYVPGSKPLAPQERKEAYLENHPYRRGALAGYPLLRKEGKDLVRQGVHFHDLTLVFQGHEEPFYIDTCCHFNKAGNVVLARAIAAALTAPISQPLLPSVGEEE
jgi:hypothetical protein